MSHIEELKIFVSERLHATTSEILIAITKTVSSYEKEVSRLMEENERHRSLLDIILKTKSSPAKAINDKSPAASAATSPHRSDSRFKQKTGQTVATSSAALPSVFTTRDEFLRLAGNGSCPFCLKKVQGSEKHLMKRHYLPAIHFIQDGKAKFVIPCMCKEKIQDRSHWHCPLCKKIIYRRCNFDAHLSKQHKIVLIQQSQDAETNQPPVTVLKTEIPESWSQQEIGNMEQENQSLLLQAKTDPEQEEYLQMQHDQQDLIQSGNGQQREKSLELNQNQDSGLNIVCIDAYIQDISEICNTNPLPNFPTRGVGAEPDTGVTKMLDPAEGSQHTAGGNSTEETGSCSKAEESNTAQITSSLSQVNPEREDVVRRSSPPKNLHTKKARPLPARQKTSGSFCCKACGKHFHYMYTLRAHVRTHALDKTCICGICGKRLGHRESLAQHLQSHNRRNICGTCGKEFSSDSRLKRHKRFHLPKGLNG